MRKVFIVCALCTMAFASAAGFAATPSVAPLTAEALAAILGPSSSCPTPQSGALLAANKPRKPGFSPLKSCSATANCESGTVFCEVPGAGGSCQAVDRNCDAEEPGHVTCNGVTTWCPTECACPYSPVCCNCFATGDCFACCRCNGGSIGVCISLCSGQ